MDFSSEIHDWFPPNSLITHLDFQDTRAHSDEISNSIKNHQVVILDSTDQSSKSFFIPHLLFINGYSENGWRIGCVYPTRNSAASKSSTLLHDLSGTVMNLNINWLEASPECRTYIQVLTPETLLMELKRCQTLDSPGTGFSAIYFDSFPMSGLKGELCLSLLYNVIKCRPEFRLVIGTLFNDQVADLLTFFNGTEKSAEGPENPIAIAITLDDLKLKIPMLKKSTTIRHLPVIPDDPVSRSLLLAEELHKTMQPGNILLFLPSSKHCQEAAELISKQGIPDLVIVARENITFSSNELKRYIFFASDVYQIDRSYQNIKYVIDSGLKVLPEFNIKNRNLYLVPSRITEHEAKLRASISNDSTYRMYPPNYFSQPPDPGTTMNFHEISLFLMAFRFLDLKNFKFYHRPALPVLSFHLLQLQQYGIITKSGLVSPNIGDFVLHFCGLPIPFARFLISSFENAVVEAAISIISLLSLNMKFHYGTSRVRQGDLLSAANFYQKFITFQDTPEIQKKVKEVKKMKFLLRTKCEQLGKITNSRQTENLIKAIVAGFFQNAAVFNVSRQVYIHLITNQSLYIHPDSVMIDLDMMMHVHYVVFGSIEVLEDQKPYMKHITVIDDPQLLVEIAPSVYSGIVGKLPSSQRQKPVRILDDSILPDSLIGLANSVDYFKLKPKKK